MQEKSQSTDFASSTGITGIICNVFCDQIILNRLFLSTRCVRIVFMHCDSIATIDIIAQLG